MSRADILSLHRKGADMQISLINGYYIEVEQRNFTLKQKYIGTKKDGTKKEAVRMHGHFGSLEQALEKFLRLNQIPHKAKLAVDLIEYVSLVEKSNKEAVQALKSVFESRNEKVFDNIIEKLEEYKYLYLVERDSEQSQHCNDVVDCELKDCSLCVFDKAIEIVKQEAEQNTSNEHINCSSDESELLRDLLTEADMQAGGQDA